MNLIPANTLFRSALLTGTALQTSPMLAQALTSPTASN